LTGYDRAKLPRSTTYLSIAARISLTGAFSTGPAPAAGCGAFGRAPFGLAPPLRVCAGTPIKRQPINTITTIAWDAARILCLLKYQIVADKNGKRLAADGIASWYAQQ
jgi:hypothetical protein